MRLASGHPVEHLDRIDSTNLEARRHAQAGETGPLWLWADTQTAGRGRLGRSWLSPPGNLYATFLFSVVVGPEIASQVSFVAALAVHDMVKALRPSLGPRIKWPNDVLIDGAKVCGVLCEVVGLNPTRIAIGCGVNVAHAPAGMPYAVACLGGDIAVVDVLQALDASLTGRLALWDEGRGFAAIREAWTDRAFGLGGGVTAQEGGELLEGVFEGLAGDGALVMRLPGGARRTIHSGEVRFAAREERRPG